MIGRTNSGGAGDPSIPVGTGKHLVTFYDFDGKVLKRQRVATGGNATAPITPTHQYLTFAEWNNPFTNVQSDIDTGAIYNTTDGKTYLFITLTPVTGLAPTLYFSKSSTSLMTIDWGDGTTSTSTTSGNQTIQHTYSTAGDYIITVDNSAGGTWSIGQGVLATSVFGGLPYNRALTKVYIGNYIAATANYAFASCQLSSGFSFGSYSVAFGSRLFSLSGIKFFAKSNNSTIGDLVCYLTSTLQKAVLKNVSLIGKADYVNTSLAKIIIPSTVVSVSAEAFGAAYYNYILIYIFLSTTPPTLANVNAFTGINPICKIYVPDASVAAYKAATNWSFYANYIYPLSQKPQSDE